MARLGGHGAQPAFAPGPGDRSWDWVEQVPDAVLVLDHSGIVVAANQTSRDSYGRSDLVGLGSEQLLPGWQPHTSAVRLEAKPYATVARRASGELVRVDVSERRCEEPADVGPVTLVMRPSTSTSGLDMFRNLVEVDPDAKILVDESGTIALVNARTEQMFGFPREELLGLPVRVILPDDVVTRAPQDEALTGSREITAHRRDGTVFPAEVSLADVKTDSGRAVLAAVRDVTDKWFAQHRFQQLVEHAPDAKIILSADGDISLVNAQAELIFGYERAELVGRPAEILLPDLTADYLSDLRAVPELTSGQHTVVRTETTWEGRRKIGSGFPVEVYLNLLETEDGVLVSAAVRDLTERNMADRRFRDLLEAAPDGQVIADEDGVIVLVNRRTEELFGWTREELCGRPIEMLLPFEVRERHRSHRLEYNRSARPIRVGMGTPLHGMRRDGSTFPVEVSVAPLETNEGTLVSAAIRDVTERVALSQNSERMKTEFLATLSHELRTPLTSIIGYSEMLEDMDEGSMSPMARRFLAVISRGAARELRLVDDLLTLVAIEGSNFDVNPKRSSLAVVVRQAIAEAAPAVHEAGQEIRLVGLDEGRADGLFGDIDDQRLVQALSHLTQNVVKHCPAGTTLSVGVRSDDTSLELELRDDGPGIAPEEMTQVFERLFRGKDAVRQERQGAGLGLAIAKAIVEGHGGSLVGESEVGRGAVFRMILPRQRTQTLGEDLPAGA